MSNAHYNDNHSCAINPVHNSIVPDSNSEVIWLPLQLLGPGRKGIFA